MKAIQVVRGLVSEFLSALTDPRSYSLRNAYLWFGFAWGIPVPIFGLWVDLTATRIPFSAAAAAEAVARHPIHAFFLLHPVLFAILFGALGTIRRRKDVEIESLVRLQERHIAELDRANSSLRELDRLKAEFVANMTHEFKTPLVSILGYNEMIADGRLGPVTPKQKSGLEVSLRNVRRLQGLVDEMLISSRIDAGMLQVRARPFGAGDSVEQAARLIEPIAERRRLSVVRDLPPVEVRAQGDPEWIGRALSNLLSNAVKFSPEGTRVRIGARRVDGKVEFFVSDEGPGIPESFRPHLFERFRQAEGGLRRANGGTGLGLSIVKGILDAHNAPIDVKTAEGRGTEFAFRLPEAKA
jgi:signal transduction histidine kinase